MKKWALLGTFLVCAAALFLLEKKLARAREQCRTARSSQAAATEELAAGVKRENRLAVASAKAPAAEARPAAPPATMYTALKLGTQGILTLRVRMRAFVSENYAALFRRWHLPPEQLKEVQNLLVEKVTTAAVLADAANAGKLPGVDAGDLASLKAVISGATDDLEGNLRKVLGDGLYNQYQQYGTTLRYRAETDDFAAQFKNSKTPIRDEQADRIVALLAANDTNPLTPLSDSFAREAAAILDPNQRVALTQLLAEAQSRRVILVRNLAALKAGTIAPVKSDGRDLLLKY